MAILNSEEKSMINKVIDNIVRFAALLSFISFSTGYSFGKGDLLVFEAVMIVIWLNMDWVNIKKLTSFFYNKYKK